MFGRLDTVLMSNSLHWINNMFGESGNNDNTCDASHAEIYMHSFEDPRFGTKYS